MNISTNVRKTTAMFLILKRDISDENTKMASGKNPLMPLIQGLREGGMARDLWKATPGFIPFLFHMTFRD